MGLLDFLAGHEENNKLVYGTDVVEPHHKAKFTHELVAGAAAFEAARKYEQYEAAQGKPQSHALAKEIFAGFLGAEVDKLVETKGMDWIDKKQAQEHGLSLFQF
ncbi:hypothetical protein HDV06_000284 [Boothiomyces sp. JEL0866]|nr:hypothetical protein HDV06_000284 [Boothiomyces sp. JEL0866]